MATCRSILGTGLLTPTSTAVTHGQAGPHARSTQQCPTYRALDALPVFHPPIEWCRSMLSGVHPLSQHLRRHQARLNTQHLKSTCTNMHCNLQCPAGCLQLAAATNESCQSACSVHSAQAQQPQLHAMCAPTWHASYLKTC